MATSLDWLRFSFLLYINLGNEPLFNRKEQYISINRILFKNVLQIGRPGAGRRDRPKLDIFQE